MAAIQARQNQSRSFSLPSALHLWDKVQRHDDKLSVSWHTWYKDSKSSCLALYLYILWCWSTVAINLCKCPDNGHTVSVMCNFLPSVMLCFTLSNAGWLLCECQRPQQSPVWKAQGKQTCTWRSTDAISTFSLISVTLPVSPTWLNGLSCVSLPTSNRHHCSERHSPEGVFLRWVGGSAWSTQPQS